MQEQRFLPPCFSEGKMPCELAHILHSKAVCFKTNCFVNNLRFKDYSHLPPCFSSICAIMQQFVIKCYMYNKELPCIRQEGVL